MMAKPGMTEGAETTEKATPGRNAWLGSEWREGRVEQAERPAARRESGGSQSLHMSTEAAFER